MADTYPNPFVNTSPLGEALKNLGRVVMSGPTDAQKIIYAEEALKRQRARTGTDSIAGMFRQFGQPGFDRNAVMADAVTSGYDPKNLAEMERYGSANTFGANDLRTTNAFVGAGGAFGGSPAGFAIAQDNEMEKFRAKPIAVGGPTGATYVRTDQSYGRPAVENLGQVQAGEARRALEQPGGIGAAPIETQRFIGAESKTNPKPLNYLSPTGTRHVTYDGKTDAQTGQPLPPNGSIAEVAGTPEQAGLSGNSAVDKQILETRVAAQTAAARIDGLVTELQKPGANQSVGYLGVMARTFNDLRSQAEATVQLFGGEPAASAFSTPEAQGAVNGAMGRVFGNPAINQRAQQLGISSAVLRSQVQDLAYAIAKAQDPSGRVSNADIERAAETIGMSIMDPTAAVAVLGDLKQRILSGQQIRESVTRSMFPNLSGAPSGAPPAAPGAVTTPPPSTAPGAPQVEKWDFVNGKLQRVK